MSANLYITTQVVQATMLQNRLVRVKFPSMDDASMLLTGTEFNREFFPLDSAEVGFGLALEGMKAGLRFVRKAWSRAACPIGISDGKLVAFFYADDSMPCTWLAPICLVANDWVVAK